MRVSSIFSPKLPHRRRAFCGNLPDMRLSHSKRQKGAKRSRHLWRVVPEGVWGAGDRVLLVRMPALDQACINAVAAGEKLYDFLSWAILCGGNPVICWLSRVPEARLTVKFKGRMSRKILPSDLPSKPFAWEQ